jgi:hypothetical protein
MDITKRNDRCMRLNAVTEVIAMMVVAVVAGDEEE